MTIKTDLDRKHIYSGLMVSLAVVPTMVFLTVVAFGCFQKWQAINQKIEAERKAAEMEYQYQKGLEEFMLYKDREVYKLIEGRND